MWLYVCFLCYGVISELICLCIYSGGSIVAEFARHKGGLLETAKIHAAVRSDEQAESLSTLDVSVVKIDLSNPYALAGYMIRNDGEFWMIFGWLVTLLMLCWSS
jgi:hypothetical protein